MRNTELLIEAIECSGSLWWQEFNDITEADDVISAALREVPEEEEIAIIISLLEPEENEYEGVTPADIYKKCLRKLRNSLREADRKDNEF